jgi:hypothetical protein
MSPSLSLVEIPSDRISIASSSSENTLHKDKSSISRLNINEDKKHLSLLASTNTPTTKETITTTTITTTAAMTTSEFSVNRTFSFLGNGEIANRKLLDINHCGGATSVGERGSPIRNMRKMSVGGLSASVPSKNSTSSNSGSAKK